jgi:hypothetical protein
MTAGARHNLVAGLNLCRARYRPEAARAVDRDLVPYDLHRRRQSGFARSKPRDNYKPRRKYSYCPQPSQHFESPFWKRVCDQSKEGRKELRSRFDHLAPGCNIQVTPSGVVNLPYRQIGFFVTSRMVSPRIFRSCLK